MSTYHHGNLKEAFLKRAAEVIELSGVEALSMRALARDLKVSSAASAQHFNGRNDLLSTLAADGYQKATAATLAAAQKVGTNPIVKLNAMAKGFVYWSINNKALFLTISHPDVSRHADDKLLAALGEFALVVSQSVKQAQDAGWHAKEETDALFQFTISAVRGIAINMTDDLYISVLGKSNRKKIDRLIDILIPVHG